MAISLDGEGAETHDSFRGVPGVFDRAMFALFHAQQIGLETQLQTTVTKRNLHKLGRIAELAADLGVKMWSLFFLIVTGRAQADDDLSGADYEKVFEFLYDISKIAPFQVKRRCTTAEAEAAKAVVYRTAGVSDGKGFVFVSHTGEIFPSGFLPISAGNVRRDSLCEVYRNSSLFRILRETELRHGKESANTRRFAADPVHERML